MLVGRDAELDRVDAALGRAEEGRGSALLLSGPAGMGKTALTVAAAARARARGFRVLSGRGWPTDSGLAYAPVLEALDPALRERSPEARARLVRGLEDLRLLFPDLELARPMAIGDPALERTRLFESVARLLRRLAAEQPLLLVIDDLHATDAATVDLLAYALRRLDGSPALLALAWRQPGAGPQEALDRLATITTRAELGDTITLSPLGRDELTALAADHLGDPPGPDLVDLLEDRTRGAPLVAVSRLRALDEGGGLLRAGDRWRLVRASVELPPEVEGLFRDALRALPPGARDVLERLAVAATPVDWSLLARLPLGTEAARAGLAHLVRTGWVVENGSTIPSWHLWHPLAQEVVVDTLTALRRQRLHRELLEALRKGHTASLSQLARHCRGAGADTTDPEWAFDVLCRAAKDARTRLAWGEAARWFDAAAELARRGVRADRLPELLRALGDTWQSVGDRRAAVQAWREARGALASAGRVEDAAALDGVIAFATWDLGDIGAARRAIDQALHLLHGRPPSRAFANLVGRAIRFRNREGDLQGVRDTARLLTGLEHVPEPLQCAVAQARYAELMADRRVSEALEALERAVALARTTEERLRAHEMLAMTAINSGIPRRWEILDEFEALVESLGTTNLLATPSFARGIGHLTDGNLGEAARHLVQALVVSERVGPPRRVAAAMGGLAMLRAYQGRLEEAEAWLQEGRSVHGGRDADRHTLDILHLAELLIARVGGDASRAAAAADRMGTSELVVPLAYDVSRAGAYLDAGRLDDALEIAAEIDRNLGGYDSPRAHVLHIRAAVAAARGDPGAGPVFLEAAELYERRGMEALGSLARLEYAEHFGGDDALRQARHAYRTLERLGWGGLLDRAGAALRRLGARAPRQKRPNREGPLSPRELEVAQLAAKGFTGPEIARALFISPHTVSTHIKKIYARIEVSSRAELTAWMIAHDHAEPLHVP